MHLKQIKSRCLKRTARSSFIFPAVINHTHSFFFPLSLLLLLTRSSPPFILATVDMWLLEWARETPPLRTHSCGNQSCHFSNYLKQSFPSPALHYLAVSFPLSSSLLSSLFLCSLSPSSHSHRPIIGDTFQLCRIQWKRVTEHPRPNKNPQKEEELSPVTSARAGCPQLMLLTFFFFAVLCRV